jgi:hypothetical protein
MGKNKQRYFLMGENSGDLNFQEYLSAMSVLYIAQYSSQLSDLPGELIRIHRFEMLQVLHFLLNGWECLEIMDRPVRIQFIESKDK